MLRTNATIYAAAAALSLCLMSPNGAAAVPAAPDLGKAYVHQTAKAGNLLQVRYRKRYARRRGHRVYRRRYCCTWRPRYAAGFGWGWPFGFGFVVGPRVWGPPYYGWGYPCHYRGCYPVYYRRRCCFW